MQLEVGYIMAQMGQHELAIDHLQEAVNRRLKHFVEYRYRPFVERCVRRRRRLRRSSPLLRAARR